MVWGSKRFERPRPWMRIVALVLAVLFALPLIDAHQPLDVVRTAILCGFCVFCAISPRAIYDGRATAWERAHPVQAAVAVFLFLSLLMFNVLTNVLTALVRYPQGCLVAGTGFRGGWDQAVRWSGEL
jgi:hypothetical protein